MAEATEKKPSFGEAVDLLVKTLKAFDEKQQRTLVVTVCALLELKIAEPQAPQQPAAGLTPPAPTPPAPLGGKDPPRGHTTDIRSLKEEKKPKSATQMAAVVGYYLKEMAPEGERRETIKTTDLEKYFIQAKYELPKKLEQVLVDSKRAGYFEVATRGEYKLTRVGHNLVAHRMPVSDN
jgi:hypothetical protein